MVSQEACTEFRDQARLIAGAAAVPVNHIEVDRKTDSETAVNVLFSAFRAPPFFLAGLNPKILPAHKGRGMSGPAFMFFFFQKDRI
jgi:hypothetical protein